jgi:hypothetical protein
VRDGRGADRAQERARLGGCAAGRAGCVDVDHERDLHPARGWGGDRGVEPVGDDPDARLLRDPDPVAELVLRRDGTDLRHGRDEHRQLDVGLVGVAAMLGISTPITAGAVISGAYLGDKLSPLSETTVLTAQMVGVDVHEHVKRQAWTSVPAFAIALCVFVIIGLANGRTSSILSASRSSSASSTRSTTSRR